MSDYQKAIALAGWVLCIFLCLTLARSNFVPHLKNGLPILDPFMGGGGSYTGEAKYGWPARFRTEQFHVTYSSQGGVMKLETLSEWDHLRGSERIRIDSAAYSKSAVCLNVAFAFLALLGAAIVIRGMRRRTFSIASLIVLTSITGALLCLYLQGQSLKGPTVSLAPKVICGGVCWNEWSLPLRAQEPIRT